MESVTPANWWVRESLRDVASVVSHINEAKNRRNDVECYELAFKSLNLLWTQLYRFQSRNGHLKPEHLETRGDTASFEELLRVSLEAEDKGRLLQWNDVEQFVTLTPPVMNHDVLRRENYDPSAIPARLRQRASEKHSELARAYRRWREQQTPESAERAVKKLADLLFVIRSNIAHGEKTPRGGPDFEKVNRDQEVCHRARPVIERLLRAIFRDPDYRLAVYETLRRGGPNHAKLAKFDGLWSEARVRGELIEKEGLPHFTWSVLGPELTVEILESPDLEKGWIDLDRFEGPSYRRIWIAATGDSGELTVVSIYASRDPVSGSRP
jgi:gamma-glutamylcyclotransferase (GGCT)/AIG2-like uncharacterized protein YtfP